MDNRIKEMIKKMGHIVGTITEFDELAKELEKLNYNKTAALRAYLGDEFDGKCIRVDDVVCAISQLSEVYLIKGVKTPFDLGRMIAAIYGMDESQQASIDYEKLAKDFNYVGRFTKDGLLLGEIKPLPF